MFSSPQNNNRVKIINKLVLSNCFLLGQTSKLTNKNFTRYLLGIRYSLEIFKLYEIRHLLLRVYPLIYNLFCRDRNLYDRMILRRYPKKIKKKRLEEFQKINPNRDGKMRFYTFRIRKNIPPKILFVSSTPQYADIVEEAALRCQMPWQTEQWLNGSITAAVSTLKSKKKWNFYFVSEQLKIEKNFRNTYGKNKEDIEYTEEKKKVYGHSHWPNLILIPDVKNNCKLLEETKEVGIPVLGLVSSDCQLNVDYPILAQDMSIHIVHFFCHFMATLIAKEMVKIQHKLFIKTKSGLFRKDRNFFDKKISSRFWYFKRELNYKHNAKKKPRIFVLQEKFINSKRRIKYFVKEELFLPWIDRIAGLSKTDTENSVEFAYFYSLFYIWSRLKIKSQWNNLNIFTKNIFLREKKYLFFLFEIFKNSYTSFFYGTYIFNLARTAPIMINNEWAKRKKLSNKNIYWTNREQKRALIKAKKNPNSFENILTYQWYGKEGRLRYNNANKMYYWIPLWLLVQRYDIKRFSKQFKNFRKIIRYINIKKKWAYQKYKKAWHGAIKKKIFKKVRKKQVLYYFLKKLASKNSYIPKSTNSKFSNKLIYVKDLNHVKKKKKKKIRKYNIHFSHKILTKKAILSAILKLKSVIKKNDTADKIVLEKEQISGSWYFYAPNQVRGMENLSEIIKDLQKAKTKKRKIKGIYKLKKRLNSESSLDMRFFKPWRYEIPFLTRKQSWLQNQYNILKILSLKNRRDFFETLIGQMMLASSFSFPLEKCGVAKNLGNGSYKSEYRFPVAKISNITCRASLFYFRRINSFLGKYFRKYQNFVSRKKIYSDLRIRNEKSWFYENTLRRKNSILFSKFKLTKFATAFHSNYREIKKRPWVEPLFFKRAALSAFEERYRKANKFEEEKLQYKFYLRNKNPRHTKRNRLYKRKIKLLANPWKGRRIMAHQSARIKQILSKLLRPFYGHLTLKQWIVLLKKNKKKRSKYQTRVQTILQHLENRLDVVVYRLNWAPSILWARRLIRGGFIFVSNIKKKYIWNKMYSSLKKYSFPLKLRDPKNLYSKTFWNPKRKKSKQFFFYISQKKINYLIQPGDMLQCSRSILINQFKNNAIWLKKPISSRFLSGRRQPKKEWRWDRHQMLEKNFNNFEFYTEHRKSVIVLSQIKLKNLPKSDRSNKIFLRWATI